MVSSGELEGLLARTDLGGNTVQLVIKDIAETLGEDERQDEVLVFRSILGTPDRTGCGPDPGFEGFPLPLLLAISV